MKQILLRTAVVLALILSVIGLFGCGSDLSEKFEDYLIEKYNLPENLEENHIYYESYSVNSTGEKIKYTVYLNDENGLNIIGEGTVYLNDL